MMADVRNFLEKKISKITVSNKHLLSKKRFEVKFIYPVDIQTCYRCDPTSTGTGKRIHLVLTVGIEEVKG